jgi:AraC-like DNA-binding protein
MSRSHLSRLLRRETGLPPCAILKRMRLQKAEALLVTTAIPIKAVAAELGYRYAGNFVRDFRKAYGQAPGAFRARAIRAGREQPEEALAQAG